MDEKKDKLYSAIAGIGSYVPERILTNADLEKIVDTSNEWIVKRTGIKERRIAADDENVVSIAINVAEKALKESGVKPEELGYIIVGQNTTDYLFPSVAAQVQDAIKAYNSACWDVQAGCAAFCFALDQADKYVKAEKKPVLFMGVDTLSKKTDWTDRNTCVLFADGGGGGVLVPSYEPGIIASYLWTEGSQKDLISMSTCYLSSPFKEEVVLHGQRDSEGNMELLSNGFIKSKYISMKGREVFELVNGRAGKLVNAVLEKANMKINDIDYFIFHQANQRITKAITRVLKLKPEKVLENIYKYGNTSAASVPLVVDEFYRKGTIKKGDILMFFAFGAGMNYGLNIVKWTI